MSLAKHIVYGSDKDVAKHLQASNEINLIDEYGYTPLIQSVIVNSITKVELLLKAEAKVDFPDLTGRTALHWAASNDNYEICELLLTHGANPNSYTTVGQPVLAMPILRRQTEIVSLLIKRGARVDFARDYINTKQLGHRFELEGRVDVVDHQGTFIEVGLEGFFLEFSLAMVANSLSEFKMNFGGKRLRKYFGKLDYIVKLLNMASELIKYQHYLYLLDINRYEDHINELLQNEILVLPIAFDGHAITLIRFWDFFVRCDRGEFGRENGSIIIYRLPTPQLLTKDLIKSLLYKRQARDYINHGLVEELDLQVMMTLPISPQKTGNCAWANVEAVVPTLLFLLLMEERGETNSVTCQAEALTFYNEWLDWDRNRELYFCLQDINDTTPARKAAKATLLAAILFQYCHYENRKDIRKANKIFEILTLPDYHYILQSYLKVFGKEPHHPSYNNLLQFFSLFGIDAEKF